MEVYGMVFIKMKNEMKNETKVLEIKKERKTKTLNDTMFINYKKHKLI